MIAKTRTTKPQKTKPQKPDPENRSKQFLADAHKKAVAARKNLAIDEETAYQTAYQAMLKGSPALMLSHGQRPRVQAGRITWRSRRSPRSTSTQPLSPAFALFDRMRRKRNDAFYDVAIISGVEAIDAVEAAERYLKAVSAEIRTRIP